MHFLIVSETHISSFFLSFCQLILGIIRQAVKRNRKKRSIKPPTPAVMAGNEIALIAPMPNEKYPDASSMTPQALMMSPVGSDDVIAAHESGDQHTSPQKSDQNAP